MIPSKDILRASALVGSAALLLYGLWLIPSLLMILVTGLLFGTLLYTGGAWTAAKLRLPHAGGVVVLSMGIVALGIVIFLTVLPSFVAELDAINDRLMTGFQAVETTVPSEWQSDLDIQNAADFFTQISGGVYEQLVAVGSGVVEATTAIVVSIIITLYLAFQPQQYYDGFLSLIPSGRQEPVRESLAIAASTLSGWFIGRVSSMVIVGLGTYGALLLLGVPAAFALAMIAGLLSFIPNLGPLLSFIPAGLVALSVSGWMVLYVAVLYVGIQTLESYFITPMIQKKMVDLLPVVVISAQLMFGLWFGLVGVLVAAPLVAVGQALLTRWYT